MITDNHERLLRTDWNQLSNAYRVSEQASAGGGVRIRVSNADGAKPEVQGSAIVFHAEDDSHLGQPGGEGLLQACSVREVRTSDAAAAALAYAIARRARIESRINVLFCQDDAVARIAQAHSPNGSFARQRGDLFAHYAAAALEASGSPVLSEYRGLEIRETAERWLDTGRSWGFFRAVLDGTLTREQYVYGLSNIYQFVRHTTRLAARAVGHSPTTEMRSHFIGHLNGEINHELTIERDLTHLGEDVQFVRDHMAPNGPTQEFMVVQESLIGYYADPVLLMASPVAAEGVTAHLDEPFIEALEAQIASWGVTGSEKAARFLRSHMHTDGGADGHWEMTVQYAGKCLPNESRHMMFMRCQRSAMRATTRLYDSFVTEIPIWHKPAPRERAQDTETTVRA